MPDGLGGRQILLAGGAGGLGSVTAQFLAGEGAQLIVSYARRSKNAESLSDIATIVQGDLTVDADRSRLLDAATELYGLVVFTGDAARVAEAAQIEAVMRRSYDVNCLGPMMLAREAAERMRRNAVQGSIVLLSTMQAVALFSGSTAYASAKAALIHSARILAKECRGAVNIRVNVIAPGVMAAGMAQASIASGKYDRYIAEGIVPRFGDAADVARAVRFFLEPDNYVTGQVLSVDGGLTL